VETVRIGREIDDENAWRRAQMLDVLWWRRAVLYPGRPAHNWKAERRSKRHRGRPRFPAPSPDEAMLSGGAGPGVAARTGYHRKEVGAGLVASGAFSGLTQLGRHDLED